MLSRASLSPRPLLFTALALLLVFAGVGSFVLNENDKAFDNHILAEDRRGMDNFQLAFGMHERDMLQLASVLAADPEITELLEEGKEAVQAEGGGAGGPRAAEIRERLRRHVQPAWEKMRDDFNARQIHFHLGPGDVSFLRMHVPDKFGDDLSALRHIVVDVNRDHQPRTGFEVGRVTSGLRGVVPVVAKDSQGRQTYAGVLEAGTSLDALVDFLHREMGTGVGVVIRRDEIDEAIWKEFLEKRGPIAVESCNCYVEATSGKEIFALLDTGIPSLDKGNKPIFFRRSMDGRTFSIIRFPLLDYRGGMDPQDGAVGSVLIWTDRSSAIAEHLATRGQIVFAAVGGYVLSLALLYGLVIAVTRRLRAKAETMATELIRERNFRDSLVDALPDSLILTDRRGVILDVNRAFTANTGYSVEEAVGQHTRMLSSGASPANAYQSLWQTILSGKIWRGELLNRRKGGEYFWEALSISPIRDERGNITHFVSLQHDVSRRKRMEEALKAGEERLRLALEATEDGVWDWDMSTGSLYWSPRCYTMLGYPADSFPITRQAWESMIHPDDREQTKAALEKGIRAGGIYRMEYRLASADDGWCWVSSRGRTVAWDGDGKAIRMVGTHIDLTDRRRMEDALRESEEKYRVLFEMLPIGIAITDPTGRVLEANRASERILGHPLRDSAGRLLDGGARTFVRSDGSPLPTQELPAEVALRQRIRVDNFEMGILHPEDPSLWISVSAVPISLERYGVAVAFIDITRRLESEQEREQNRILLTTIINAAPIGIWLLADDGRPLLSNRAFDAWTGLGQGELSLTPDELAICQASDRRALESDVPYLSEETLTCLDGRRRTFQIIKSRLQTPGSQSMGVVGIAVDITEKKEWQEQLEERVRQEVARNMENERLLIQQSRLAAMGEMIGNIAHQWRQPINALGLMLFNLRDAWEFGELDQSYLDKTLEDSQRLIKKMSSTIDDFRNFFKPNKQKEVFTLRHSVDDTIAILSASLRSHRIVVEVAEEEAGMAAAGYPNEFSQVLLNIVNNARDALLARKVAEGRIDIRIYAEGSAACVGIRDNAGGIPKEIVDRVFDPYFTTKETGTGIGLYMSRVIIEHNMQGRIEACNVEGGAQFTVCCPRSYGIVGTLIKDEAG